jgi:DNA polymerase elongation subunit (family B)
MNNQEPRVLLYDIEVSPCQGWFWRTGKSVIGAHQIRRPGKIICIAYKFSDEDKIHSLQWDSKQSDEKMVKEFYKIADKADIIVGHNGDSFDKKWINTRLAYYHHPTLRHIDTEDTLKQCRKEFNMPSFRLDYICKFFKIPGKLSTSSSLWEDVVFENDKQALKDMVKYCENDVLILDALWKRIHPFVKNKINYNSYIDKPVCSSCGSLDIHCNGTRKAGMTTWQHYYCKAHGGYAGKAPIKQPGRIR